MKKLLTLVLALAMTLSLAPAAAVERTWPMKAARAALPASHQDDLILRGGAYGESWRPAWPPLKRSTTWTSK